MSSRTASTPVLCQGRSKPAYVEINDTSMGHLPDRWLRLTCCDSEDYCNGGIPDRQDHRKPPSNPNRDPVVSVVDAGPLDKPSDPPDRYHDKKPPDSNSTVCTTNGINSSTIQQVKPLHVAALVLAFAAVISVFAACYVITRYANIYFYLWLPGIPKFAQK